MEKENFDNYKFSINTTVSHFPNKISSIKGIDFKNRIITTTEDLEVDYKKIIELYN